MLIFFFNCKKWIQYSFKAIFVMFKKIYLSRGKKSDFVS